MEINAFIKHKEIAIIYEESGLVIINYNALITHPKSKLVTCLVVTYTIVKQYLVQIVVKLVMLKKHATIGKEKNLQYMFPLKLLNQ